MGRAEIAKSDLQVSLSHAVLEKDRLETPTLIYKKNARVGKPLFYIHIYSIIQQLCHFQVHVQVAELQRQVYCPTTNCNKKDHVWKSLSLMSL